jgi:hypothetical protein
MGTKKDAEDCSMRSFAFLALAGVALADSSALAQRGRRGSEGAAARNGWVFSLSAGKALARKTGKPLMVVLRCVP